jgi:hypothetical protein
MKSKTTLHRFILVPAFAIAAFAFISAPTVKAELVLDTTGDLSLTDQTFAGNDLWVAQGFTTSAGLWDLNSVTLVVENAFGSVNFIVAIYGDSVSNTPGSLIATLSGNPSPAAGAAGNYTYSPVGTLSLTGSTSYWIVASTDSKDGGGYFVYQTSFEPAPPVGVWSIPSDANPISFDGGISWNQPGEAPPNWAFSINATPVPEPSTYALLVLAAAALGFHAWRRRRRA